MQMINMTKSMLSSDHEQIATASNETINLHAVPIFGHFGIIRPERYSFGFENTLLKMYSYG